MLLKVRGNKVHGVRHPAAAVLFVEKKSGIPVSHNDRETYTRRGNKVHGLA
jgi:hypothetical protein